MYYQLIALIASLSLTATAPTSEMVERSTAVTSCTAPYTAKCCTSIDNVVLVTIPLALGIGCKPCKLVFCDSSGVFGLMIS